VSRCGSASLCFPRGVGRFLAGGEIPTRPVHGIARETARPAAYTAVAVATLPAPAFVLVLGIVLAFLEVVGAFVGAFAVVFVAVTIAATTTAAVVVVVVAVVAVVATTPTPTTITTIPIAAVVVAVAATSTEMIQAPATVSVYEKLSKGGAVSVGPRPVAVHVIPGAVLRDCGVQQVFSHLVRAIIGLGEDALIGFAILLVPFGVGFAGLV